MPTWKPWDVSSIPCNCKQCVLVLLVSLNFTQLTCSTHPGTKWCEVNKLHCLLVLGDLRNVHREHFAIGWGIYYIRYLSCFEKQSLWNLLRRTDRPCVVNVLLNSCRNTEAIAIDREFIHFAAGMANNPVLRLVSLTNQMPNNLIHFSFFCAVLFSNYYWTLISL